MSTTYSTKLKNNATLFLLLLLVRLALAPTSAQSDWNNQSQVWLEDEEYDDGSVTESNTPAPSPEPPQRTSLATILAIVAALLVALFFPFFRLVRMVRRQCTVIWKGRPLLQQDPALWPFDDLPEDSDVQKGVRTVCQQHKLEVCCYGCHGYKDEEDQSFQGNGSDGCGTDYTVLNQLCYHYYYIMSEDNMDDRFALTRCFLAVHFQNIQKHREAEASTARVANIDINVDDDEDDDDEDDASEEDNGFAAPTIVAAATDPAVLTLTKKLLRNRYVK